MRIPPLVPVALALAGAVAWMLTSSGSEPGLVLGARPQAGRPEARVEAKGPVAATADATPAPTRLSPQPGAAASAARATTRPQTLAEKQRSARAQDAAQARPQRDDAAPPSPAAPLRLVAGRCLRKGQPLAGMTLLLRKKDGSGPSQNLTTDADGWFRRALPEAGEYLLRATGPGLSRHQRSWDVTVSDGEAVQLGDLHLRTPVRIEGLAANEDGAPIADAEVLVQWAGQEPIVVATTAADGSFDVADIGDGDGSILVQKGQRRGGQRLHVDGSEPLHELQITMEHIALVRCEVRDDDGLPQRAALSVTGVAGRHETVCDAMGQALFAAERSARVLVTAQGCLPHETTAAQILSAERIELRRLRTLHGRLRGEFAAATVRIGPADASLEYPDAVRARFAAAHPVDAEGRFTIQGLTTGRYAVAATSATGAAPIRFVDLPISHPISLQMQSGIVLHLEVRDERGAPVPFCSAYAVKATAGADAKSLLAGIDPEAGTLGDSMGRIDLVVADPTGLHALLAKDGHLPAFLAMPAPGRPTPCTLPRAVRVSGHVLGFSQDLPYAIRALAWRRGESPAAAIELPIDERGAFFAPALPRGDWVFAVERTDRTHGASSMARPLDLPLLGGGVDERSVVHVQAEGGEQLTVDVPLSPLAEVRGVVRVGGQPANGAVVYAVPKGQPARGPAGRSGLGFDSPLAAADLPRTTTGRDGAFAMLAQGPGRFELRALVAGQPVGAAPVEIEVQSRLDAIDVMLDLPHGVVRGAFAIDAKDRDAVRICLLPLRLARIDPFAKGPDGRCDLDLRACERLGDDGFFEFRAVPQGDFVLRVAAHGRILRQRLVRVDDGIVELGALRPFASAPAKLVPLASDEPVCTLAHVLQRVPGSTVPFFVKAIERPTGIDLSGLPAGPYLVALFGQGKDGPRTLLAEMPIDLRGDGGTAPATLALAR